MSDTINTTQKIYQFLTNYGTDWKTEADKDGDGIIKKSEFRQFLGDSITCWNGEELKLDDEMINAFWNTFDTKTSGKINSKINEYNSLSAKEQAKLDESMNDYIVINEYAKKLQVPSGIKDGSRWKNSVKESILNHLPEFTGEFNGEKETIEEFVARYGEIAQAKATADCYADEYFEQTINGLKDKIGSDYKLKEDSVFSKIVDDYIAQLDLSNIQGETLSDKLEVIKNDIKALLDDYMKTAGLPDGEGDTQATELNDLQKAVAQKAVLDNLSSLRNSDEYKNFQADFDEAVLAFIEENQGKTFGELKSLGVSAFGNSKAKKTLDDVIYVKTNYINNISDEFYKKLIDEYGQELADIIKYDGKHTVYDDVVNEVLEKVKSGELEATEAGNYILEVIGKHLLELFGGDATKLSLDQLEKVYNAQMNAAIEKDNKAETQEEREEALADQRNAALTYCDGISSKGEVFVKTLNEIFGDDYKEAINGMLPHQIQTKMNEVLEKVEELGDATKMKLADSTWNNIPDTIGFENRSMIITPCIEIDAKEHNVDSDRITYTSSDASVLKVADDGTITVDNSKPVSKSITISVLVDGVKIGTKVVKVNITKADIAAANSKIDTNKIDFTKVSGYYEDYEYHERGNGWSGSKDKAREKGIEMLSNEAFKSQIKSQITTKLKEAGISSDMIDIIFERVYTLSMYDTLDAEDMITGRGARGFSSEGHAYLKVKKCIDAFIITFNQNLKTELENYV